MGRGMSGCGKSPLGRWCFLDEEEAASSLGHRSQTESLSDGGDSRCKGPGGAMNLVCPRGGKKCQCDWGLEG